MKRKGVIGIAVAGMVLLAAPLLIGYLQSNAYAGPEYSAWPPTPEAIRHKVGSAAAPAPGMSEKDRRELFCTLFKSRYRDHDPKVAIGIRFLAPNRIKLMCPARLEPFYVDQIALAAWRETRDDLGQSADVDIFDTFIGTAQVKIGELRAPGKEQIAHITYDYTALQKLTGTHYPVYRRRWPVQKPQGLSPFGPARSGIRPPL